MSKKVCVTGGGGFIGSQVTEECLSRGHDVVVVDDFSTGDIRNIESFRDRVDLRRIDIRSESELSDALSGVDWIFHQAAMPSVPRSMESPVETTDITLMGTINLLNVAAGMNVERVVYASSSSVYGDQEQLPKVETMRPDPRSPYAGAKRSKEIFARIFSTEFDVETVGLRYFNVFGPKQDPTSAYAAVIPAFVSNLLSGEPPVIYGDGEQSRDFTYVEDVVDANFAAIKDGEPGMSYNIGYNQQTTVNELFELIREIIGCDIEPEYDDPRPGDVRHSRADASAFRNDTGFAPGYSVKEGLEHTVEWYKKHPERWRKNG